MNIKERIKRFLTGESFFKSVLKVGSGNLIGQAIALITAPILSRIYSDAAYGDRLIVVSTAAIIMNISTLGLNSAIMKPSEDEEAKRVFTTAALLNLFISTVVALGCFLLQKWFHLIEVSGSYFVSLLLLWMYMIAYTAQSLLAIYTNKKGKYNRLFFNPIIGAAANVLLAIPLGLLGFGYEGFLITAIVSQSISVIHMAWKNVPLMKGYRWSDFIHVIKTYKEYILFQYPSNFLMNTGNEYPTQFLGRSFTAEELGSYSMCLNIMKYPIRLIAGPVSTVYFRTATEYHRQGKNLADFTYNMIRKILLISFIPVVICCIFSEKIFEFVLGASWGMAGTIAAIKATEYIMLFCADCVGYCRVSIGKQKSNLVYAIIKLIVIVAFSVIGYELFHSLMGTILMITIGNTLLHILDMSINFFYLNKKIMWKYCIIALCYVILIGAVLAFKYLYKSF